MVSMVAGLWSLPPAPKGCLTVCAQGCSQSPWHPFLHPSMQALQTAAGMSCPGTDPHAAWSCPGAESSKLREGRRKENMVFLPRLVLSSCPLRSPSHLLVEANTSAPRRRATWHSHHSKLWLSPTPHLFFSFSSWQSALTWVTSSLCFQSPIFCTWGQTLSRH